MAEFILTPTAQRHLRSIRDYLADAPEEIRNRVIAELTQTFWQAVRFPESGRLEPELMRANGETPRSLLCYPYRVFYYPDSSPRIIYAVIHGKRDPVALLRRGQS
jgi:plasmid stabilization system protein ParE